MRNYVAVCLLALCLGGLSACSSGSSSGGGGGNGGGGSTTPTISGAAVSPTAVAATVTWTTNIAADSRVDYGATSKYGSNVSDGTLVTSHSLSISSLSCNTLYHYMITSTASGNAATTPDATFNTSACAAPSITSLSPTSGAAGTAVTITGTNFGASQGSSTVTFNGTAATPSSWSNTSINVTVPAAATTGNVIVTVGGQASQGVSFTVVPVPTITSLSPTSGPVGATVTITGTNFGASQGSSTVTFNGTAGTPSSWSATSITVLVPASATTGNVVVTVNGVASNGQSFAVLPTPSITSLSPNSGTVGTTVTITGTNFGATQGTSTVTFNGTAAPAVSWSATSISVYVPANAASGNVVVAVSGVSSNAASFSVSGPGAPISDDFHGSVLNPMWSFYANCCGFDKLNGTDALLIVPSYTNHNIYGTNGANIVPNEGVGLLQPIANGDFSVQAKFDSLVTQGDQIEGILVQQDSNDFLFFGFYNDGNSPRTYVIQTSGGIGSDLDDAAISVPNGTASLWMRVQRSGNTWTQWWSADGSAFTQVATFTQSLSVSSIGPFAGNNTFSGSNPPSPLPPVPSFSAAVDYFENLSSPISSPDGGMPAPPNQPVFNVWYGDTQTFGQNGVPQQEVNILGNVSAPTGIASAYFTLNGAGHYPLTIGQNANSSRVVDTGDFNVEMCVPTSIPVPAGSSPCTAPVAIQAGNNTVVISATDNQNHTTTNTVTLIWDSTAPPALPYTINWSTAGSIQSVAQIVDGQWAIQSDGTVRTMQTGYDRLIALGDHTWTNYQVQTQMTVNAFDCQDYAVGIIVGWNGNTNGPPNAGAQPTTGHYYYGLGGYATVYPNTAPNANLYISENTTANPELALIQDTSGFKLTTGTTYDVIFSVQQSNGGDNSTFKLWVWPHGGTQPTQPNLTVANLSGDGGNIGSIILAANRVDVSFGNVTVTALPSLP